MKIFSLILVLMYATAAGATSRTLVEDTVGCHDRAQITKIVRLAKDGEATLSRTEMARAIKAGQCAILRKGTLVFIQDYEFLAGISEVRLKGQTDTLWIRNRALYRKK